MAYISNKVKMNHRSPPTPKSKENQSPKGIKLSAVPLPCSTFLGSLGGNRAAAPIGDRILL